VHVNGQLARASTRLREGDRVQVALIERAPEAAPAPESLPIVVVYEDAHLIVVDKPAGLVVHPGAGVSGGTLVNALIHHTPGIRAVGGADRPGIVHRLDKDTSGLLVVAKTERVHRALVEAMRRHDIRRVYWALVWGDPRASAGTIDAPIGRDPRQRKRMAVVRTGGRPARTHWRAVERFGVATRLEIRLETGRTHQIRVHLAYVRHPVVGDPTYGGRPKKQLSADDRQRSLAADLLMRLSRQALHAVELTFTHPVTGEERTFTSSIPGDLKLALDRLRASAPDRRA